MSLPITRENLDRHFAAVGLSPWQRASLHDRLAPHLAEVGSVNAKAAVDLNTLKGALSAAESLRIDPKRKTVLTRIKASLQRFGYDWSDDKPIDAQRLEKCFAGQDVTERLSLKVAMRACQMLPRYS